ncbi:hypothetical protein [Natranaerofaba carboxydovora]|uniref:hypothetical protein n=1 Tax=Natranaerofaba carboxydovora TaxID=2742683 RepID=UPI001F146BF8|nr:hypothetical protein [Natranaerofaba carboxydovora]UMZ75437.1 hypothetical protein ACONDI_03065 [Natranaerofaba carboxydovora]
MQSMKKPMILLGFILLLLITGLVIPDEEKSEADSEEQHASDSHNQEDATEKRSEEEKFLATEEINEIAEEKAEEYSDYDLLELTRKDDYKGLETNLETRAYEDEQFNNREYLYKQLLRARDYGAKYVPDDETMRKNLFIMDLLNLQTKLPQPEYDTVVPGIDYEEFQHLKNNLPDDFKKDKLQYNDGEELSDRLINPSTEFLYASKGNDEIDSRINRLNMSFNNFNNSVYHKFNDDKTQAEFVSSPDLINFIENASGSPDLTSMIGFLIIKTTDEDNQFDIPADENAYKVPIYLYIEPIPRDKQFEKMEEKDLKFGEVYKIGHKVNEIIHFEIIEDDNLPIKEVDCERTLEYYFPEEAMEENEYYREEFFYKMRRHPQYRNRSIYGDEMLPARWHEQSLARIVSIFRTIQDDHRIPIDDPDKINSLFFY